jgi:hypothetical protein
MRARHRGHIVVMAIVALGGGAIGGCNWLSGIDDFSVELEGGSDADQTATEGSVSEAAVDGTAPADVTADATTGADARPDSPSPVDAGHGSDATSVPDVSTTCGTGTCPTPLCCDGGCATTHFNGLGQFFYDCEPPNTYNVTQAVAACAAFTGSASKCVGNPVSCKNGSVICSSGTSTCACWAYDNTLAGHFYNSINSTCYCPGMNSGTWN